MFGKLKWLLVLRVICPAALVILYGYISISVRPTNTHNTNVTVISQYKDFPDITFYVKTTSTEERLLLLLYCSLLRSAVFFWPGRYGRMVLVLDDSAADHIFGQRFQKQIKTNFPERALDVFYEPPPDNKTLQFPKMQRTLGYNMQMWNGFFLDKYTNDSIIAYMDTDAQFRVPITKEYLLGKDGNKLWVIGTAPPIDKNHRIMKYWARSTQKALGLKVVACFMIAFPQMLHRDTIINTRKYIMNRFNTTDFGFALRKFFGPSVRLSPINILMHYAWYFERDRYSWHIILKNVSGINVGLPEKHRITPQDTIPGIVGVAHQKRFQEIIFKAGYCETMGALGKPVAGCRNISHNLNTICMRHVTYPHLQTQYPDSASSWCEEGNERACCREALNKHYQQVTRMPPEFHFFNITKAKVVEALAKESGVKCPSLVIPS